MGSEIFIIIAVLLIGYSVCLCYLFYTIGFMKGMQKAKQIDDEILKSKGIMVD